MKRKKYLLENVLVTGYAAEGKSIARQDGKVIFIEGAVPGDVVDVFVSTNKKDYGEGKATRFHEYSKERTAPFCRHFGICGGCKWQMLPYPKQLEYKQQEVVQNFRRIGKVALPEMLPIIGSDDTIHYRNKLDFTFSNKRYLTAEEIKTMPPPAPLPPKGGGLDSANINSFSINAIPESPNIFSSQGKEALTPTPSKIDTELVEYQNPPSGGRGALGFHVPRIFDKIIDIHECFLMEDVNNAIRNSIRDFALENKYSFYDIKQHTGWLRNIIIRYCVTGELMVNICLGYEDEVETKRLLDFVLQKVPAITTLLYTINPKWNDTITTLIPRCTTVKDL